MSKQQDIDLKTTNADVWSFDSTPLEIRTLKKIKSKALGKLVIPFSRGHREKLLELLKASAGVLMLTLLVTGCRKAPPVRAPKAVRLNIPAPQIVDGSLWQMTSRGQGLVADTTARKMGDLLTILVVEDTSAKRNRKMDTSRKQAIDAKIDQAIYPEYLLKGGNLPALKMSSSRTANGNGTIEDTGTVKTTISAQVTRVLPNGNLELLGQKQVIVSGETQIISLTGIARPEDVFSNNTILSTKLAEARISITGSGPLDSVQRRTLVTRILDWVNLF